MESIRKVTKAEILNTYKLNGSKTKKLKKG